MREELGEQETTSVTGMKKQRVGWLLGRFQVSSSRVMAL